MEWTSKDASSPFGVESRSNGECIWVEFADSIVDLVHLVGTSEVSLGKISHLLWYERLCLSYMHQVDASDDSVLEQILKLVNRSLIKGRKGIRHILA